MKPLLALSLLLMYGATLAAPAPWYWWVSKTDGSRACSQWALGPGWKQVREPYLDSRCEKPAVAK